MSKKGRKPRLESLEQAASPPRETPAEPSASARPFHEILLAIGVAIIVLMRPWRDGITFPTDNVYYLWGILLLVALWAVRLVFRGETIRFGTPIVLYGAFWLAALLTGIGTIQTDATYRSILFWTGHGLLFLLALNGLRSATAIGIVLASFVVVAFAESFHSLVHLRYFLPQMRREVMAQPELLSLYFGADQLTPELARRLNSNRAFGSFLFPNALAAFLLLVVPYTLGATVSSARRLVRVWREKPWAARAQDGDDVAAHVRKAQDRRLNQAALAGLVTWAVSAVIILIYYSFFFVMVYQGRDWSEFPYRWGFYVGVVPLVLGATPLVLIRLYGVSVCWLVVQALVLPVVCAISSVALWYTYSRGGALALIFAVAVTAVLFRQSRRRTSALPKPGRKAGATAAVLLVLVAVAISGADNAASPATGPTASQPGAASAAASPVAQPAPASPQAPRKNPLPPDQQPKIILDGTNLTPKDLANPASFGLRLTYWRTGLIMAKDNLWRGVGLGNFGTAYPKYQYLGAGEVKQAHNDFLQMLCETGVFGCALFSLFWCYVAVWGARRLLAERDPGERWLLAGLYASVLAFLVHGLVDFDFFNPSLATFEFLLAGILFSRASLHPQEEAKRASSQATRSRFRHPIAGVALLVVAAVTAGASVRVYRSDVIVKSRVERETLYRVGQFFLVRVNPKTFDRTHPPVETARAVEMLMPDRQVINSFGGIQAPVGGESRGYRTVGPTEDPIPPNSVLVVTNPELAQVRAREAIRLWIEKLEYADAIYPYSPDVAAHLFQWYDLLAETARDPQEKKQYTLGCQQWAQACADRSPEQAIFHECLAKALWRRGSIETGPKQLECYREGLEQYRLATVLYAIEPYEWQNYGDALQRLGAAFKKAGDAKSGDAMIDEGKQAIARAQELAEKRKRN